MQDLELALLRRGLHDMTVGLDRCRQCRRTPLMGERVYVLDSGVLLCELCRERQRNAPTNSRVVHGGEFGHTLRVGQQRAA